MSDPSVTKSLHYVLLFKVVICNWLEKWSFVSFYFFQSAFLGLFKTKQTQKGKKKFTCTHKWKEVHMHTQRERRSSHAHAEGKKKFTCTHKGKEEEVHMHTQNAFVVLKYSVMTVLFSVLALEADSHTVLALLLQGLDPSQFTNKLAISI